MTLARSHAGSTANANHCQYQETETLVNFWACFFLLINTLSQAWEAGQAPQLTPSTVNITKLKLWACFSLLIHSHKPEEPTRDFLLVATTVTVTVIGTVTGNVIVTVPVAIFVDVTVAVAADCLCHC